MQKQVWTGVLNPAKDRIEGSWKGCNDIHHENKASFVLTRGPKQ